MEKKTILKIVIVVAFFGFIVLAAGGYFGYVKFLKPVLAFRKATEVMQEFKTAEFDMIADYDTEFPSLNMNMDMKMDGEGKIDVDGKALEMDMVMNLIGEEIEFSQVMKDGNVYVKAPGEDWQEVDMEEELGNMGMSVEDFKENQMWAQNTDAEMEYLGVEELDGKKYYTYSLDISGDVLEDYVDDLMGAMGQSTGQAAFDDIDIESISVKTWVSMDTSMPYKEEVEVKNARFESGEPVGEMVMNMVMEITYFNVNEPVEIETPEV